jgi:predicted amidophosphoribosyltransferase
MTDSSACPACKNENREEAAYCDQCGQHLLPHEPGAEGDGDCPACGGKVESRGEGKGVCASCGLELVETPEEAPAPAADAGAAERLTAAILEKTKSGLPVERAVAEACREIFSQAAPEDSAPEGAPLPCPLCGAENPQSAPKCASCGLWFHRLRAPAPCPRCERPVVGDGKCECGAILTLPKLLEFVERSVRWVCLRCRAPYAQPQAKCPDCGGGLTSADRIKAFASDVAAR